ncbi:MAG: hypothetical protein QOF48_2718 [Verrucomicrobiota bacterium]|jgi:hypothetical protein
MYKILGTDNKEYGPVPVEQVRQWIVERRLNAQSLVQPEGAATWKPLSLFPEFSAVLASGPIPPGLPGMARPAQPVAAGNNSMAVASLICGCVGLVCCQAVSIAGLILGIIALGQIRSHPHQDGRGMAIAGIILSCMGLALFVLLLALGVFGALIDNLR